MKESPSVHHIQPDKLGSELEARSLLGLPLDQVALLQIEVAPWVHLPHLDEEQSREKSDSTLCRPIVLLIVLTDDFLSSFASLSFFSGSFRKPHPRTVLLAHLRHQLLLQAVRLPRLSLRPRLSTSRRSASHISLHHLRELQWLE